MKKAISLILTLCLVLALCAPVGAAGVGAVLSPQKLTVDGKSINCEKYNIGGDNYFKLRDLAYLLNGTGSQFAVGWDDASRTVSITTGKAYTTDGSEMVIGADKSATAQPSAQTIKIDGVTRTDLTVYNLDGNNFFRLRDLGKALGFFVDYDGKTNTAIVEAHSATDAGDYARALDLGYVAESWADRSLREQVTSREYKAMLTALVTELAPEELDYFNAKVTDYDAPLTRGMAVTMSWYAAVCIGADSFNYTGFDHTRADGGDFWDSGEEPFEKLFLDCMENIPVETKGGTWPSDYTAAFLWNLWHKSPISGLQVVAFDEAAESMRNHDPFTVENAVCAVARLYDSDERPRFVSVDDPAAAAVTISKAVLAKAAATEVNTIDDLPRLTGFVLDINQTSTAKDIRTIADWGFTSARIVVTYETFFTGDCTKVNLTELQKLDNLIAAAIRSDLHLNLLLISLPGRTAWSDADFNSGGEFDLFINPEKMERAELVWRTLAERYKNIPGAYLSFTPFFEAMNKNLSTGAAFEEYDENDVCEGLDTLIAAIRAVDPERFIIYEATPNNDAEWTIRESRSSYDRVSEKYDNVRLSFNFCEMPYVYAEMTATEGAHIDFNNHSLFKPEYPVTIYAAQKRLDGQNTMTIDGCLPAGTQIDLYLARTGGNGTFTISSENGTLYSERLSERSYTTSYLLSGYYPYATSDKKISITLARDTDAITLRCENCSVEWSGMDVTLPDSYAVERWYSYTQYDAYLNGEPEAAGMSLRKTSRVMLCPNSDNIGRHITIHEDVTYSSEAVYAQSTKETIEAWGKEISAFTPKALVRFENAYFNAGTTEAAIQRYYDDMLSMFDKYGFDWYSNDYNFLFNGAYAGAELVQYGEYRVDLKLLQLLQKHQ